eukprot:542063-Pleurochrysis_carterae.AAC.1
MAWRRLRLPHVALGLKVLLVVFGLLRLAVAPHLDGGERRVAPAVAAALRDRQCACAEAGARGSTPRRAAAGRRAAGRRVRVALERLRRLRRRARRLRARGRLTRGGVQVRARRTVGEKRPV